MMKKKSLVLAAVMAACATSFAFATPQTQWNQGQWQLDLGAWNPKASVDSSNWDKSEFSKDYGQEDTDSKWDFQGGLGYGLSDKWALQYNYYGLKTKSDNNKSYKTDGDEHEVNLVYSINKNFAAYAGWNRIKNDLGGDANDTNNVAQLGLIAKAPLAKNLDFYAKGAVGTKKTTMWEAGLGYSITPDLDINAGYRYLNTKLADGGDSTFGNKDDANISYKGFIAGLSYRFGGGHKEAPAPEPVYTPEPTPAPVVKRRSRRTITTLKVFTSASTKTSRSLPNALRWTTSSRLLKQSQLIRSNSSATPMPKAPTLTTMTFPNAA